LVLIRILLSLNFYVLERNLISGSIPAELGELESLIVLIAGGNNFTGSVPSELGNLDELQTLDFGMSAILITVYEDFFTLMFFKLLEQKAVVHYLARFLQP